jgi:hypothetical protein
MASMSIDDREPKYIFHLHGSLDAKSINCQSYLTNTSTGVDWTVTGDLARALQRLEDAAREEEALKHGLEKR